MFQNLSIVDKIGQLENTINAQNKIIQSLLERMEMMAEENREQKKTIGEQNNAIQSLLKRMTEENREQKKTINEISHKMETITILSCEHDNKINQLIEEDRNQEEEIGYIMQSVSTSIGRVEEKMSAYTGCQILIGKKYVHGCHIEICSPLFIHLDDPIVQPSIVANLYGKFDNDRERIYSQLYIESICLLKPKYIDMFYLCKFTVYFKGKVFLDGSEYIRRMRSGFFCAYTRDNLQPYIEELKKYCNPLGIEITFNGHDPL
jgi:hypothetical protein